ncbi:MAG: flagellar filament capping protein FliD, partial [bacterium]
GATPYHLVLNGNETGADNTITILDTAENPTDLGDGTDFDPDAWSITQQAQNAQLRINGFPDPNWGWDNPWIESATNDISDLIPGITLHLKQDSGGETITLSLSLNTSAIKEKVNSLLSSYNELRSTLTSLIRYDPTTQTAGVLIQDSQVRFIINQLNDILSAPIPGTSASDTYQSLGDVGVKIGSEGRLTLDEETFEEALQTDPLGVARLFTIDAISSSSFVSVMGTSIATQGGTHSFTITYDAEGKIDPSGTNTIAGENAQIFGNSVLAGAKGSSGEGLILMLTNPGNGPNSISGTIHIYKGFASLLLEKATQFTESEEGVIPSVQDRLNEAIKRLDDRITEWERRLQTIENNYKKRFQEMETLISQMRQVGNYLNSITTNL